MKASLCLGVAVGLMAFGGLSSANAVVGGKRRRGVASGILGRHHDP
jgi:hypothetical protein